MKSRIIKKEYEDKKIIFRYKVSNKKSLISIKIIYNDFKNYSNKSLYFYYSMFIKLETSLLKDYIGHLNMKEYSDNIHFLYNSRIVLIEFESTKQYVLQL